MRVRRSLNLPVYPASPTPTFASLSSLSSMTPLLALILLALLTPTSTQFLPNYEGRSPSVPALPEVPIFGPFDLPSYLSCLCIARNLCAPRNPFFATPCRPGRPPSAQSQACAVDCCLFCIDLTQSALCREMNTFCRKRGIPPLPPVNGSGESQMDDGEKGERGNKVEEQGDGQEGGEDGRGGNGREDGEAVGQANGKPAGQPSSQPAGQPSSQPSGQPAGQPAGQPSDQPAPQHSGQNSGQSYGQPNGQTGAPDNCRYGGNKNKQGNEKEQKEVEAETETPWELPQESYNEVDTEGSTPDPLPVVSAFPSVSIAPSISALPSETESKEPAVPPSVTPSAQLTPVLTTVSPSPSASSAIVTPLVLATAEPSPNLPEGSSDLAAYQFNLAVESPIGFSAKLNGDIKSLAAKNTTTTKNEWTLATVSANEARNEGSENFTVSYVAMMPAVSAQEKVRQFGDYVKYGILERDLQGIGWQNVKVRLVSAPRRIPGGSASEPGDIVDKAGQTGHPTLSVPTIVGIVVGSVFAVGVLLALGVMFWTSGSDEFSNTLTPITSTRSPPADDSDFEDVEDVAHVDEDPDFLESEDDRRETEITESNASTTYNVSDIDGIAAIRRAPRGPTILMRESSIMEWQESTSILAVPKGTPAVDSGDG